MNTEKLPKGIIKLPNGHYRAQIRRAGFKRFDVVSTDLQHVIAEHAAELARQTGVTSDTGVTMSMKAAAEAYLESTLFEDKSPKTRYEEKLNLAPVLAELGEMSLVHIYNNLSVVTRYRDKRLKTISPRTKKKTSGAKTRVEIAALSSVFIWAVDQELFAKNPLDGLHRGKASPQRKRRFEGEEETTLSLLTKKAKDPLIGQIARFLLILLEIGCRPGELSNVQESDVNLAEREILFRNTKNGTDRAVYITDVAAELIGEQLMFNIDKNNERLFFANNQKTKAEVPYNYAHFVNKLRTAKMIGEDFITYAGRKEFVSRGMEADINVATLQMMTGHKTLQAIERYRVDLKMNDKTRATMDAHSEELQLRAAEKALNKLPMHLRQVLLERKVK